VAQIGVWALATSVGNYHHCFIDLQWWRDEPNRDSGTIMPKHGSWHISRVHGYAQAGGLISNEVMGSTPSVLGQKGRFE